MHICTCVPTDVQFDRYLSKIQRKEFLPNSAVLPHILKVRGKLLFVPIHFLNAKIFVSSVRYDHGTIRRLFGNVCMTSLHQLRAMSALPSIYMRVSSSQDHSASAFYPYPSWFERERFNIKLQVFTDLMLATWSK